MKPTFLLRRSLPSLWAAAGVLMLAWQLSALADSAPTKSAEPASAAAMMTEAHNGRVVWKDFPGFQARIRCQNDGVTVEGNLVVSSKGDIELTIPKDEGFTWVEKSLDSIIGHRIDSGSAITNVQFADDQAEHPQGRLIKSTDENDPSLWRVKGDVLTEVHRHVAKTHFVISVGEVARNAEGKHLPRSFVVTTWDNATKRIESVRQVQNEWTRVGTIDLPTKVLAVTNKSDGSRVSQQIELSNHVLAK